MAKQTLKKATIRKFVAEVNENGNTGANFIDLAAQNNFYVSDLGAVFIEENKYVWNVDGVGRLIELKNGTLLLEEE